MDILRKRLRSYFLMHFYRLEPWRWVIILLVGGCLARLEVYEFRQQLYLHEPFHVFEAILYFVLIIGNGAFLELFVRLNRIHRRMIKILEYKHQVSLEFSLINDWESVTMKLSELPSRIVNAREAYLLLDNSISGKLEVVARWVSDEQELITEPWDPTIECRECSEISSDNQNSIHLCCKENQSSPYSAYSLKINHHQSALLKFRLQPGVQLNLDEKKIFNNIVDEIAVALNAGQNQRRISELQSAEVAMRERRMISAYLHDQLGQNLAYLHLKLDQLNTYENMILSNTVRDEIERLREIANDSYEIVRNILKKMQPETIPHLTNLLKEYATRVSRMERFVLNFECIGTPVQLLPNVQQAIFYAFHEIMSNVQKHSKANSVDVIVTWGDTCLDICVADNGVGFDPESVQKQEHFGLAILRERAADLRGQLLIDSSEDSGTVVAISIPILSPMKIPYTRTVNERVYAR